MLINPVPRMDAELSIPRIADAFLVEGKGSVVTTLYCWSKNKSLETLFDLPTLADNTELFRPSEPDPEWGKDNLFEVDVSLYNPFLVTDQMEAKRLTWNRETLMKIMEKGHDSLIVTEHSLMGGTHNYIMLLNLKRTRLRSRYLGSLGDMDPKPTQVEFDQEDFDQVKKERDMLADAIKVMGIELGYVWGDQILSGHDLLQICKDTTTFYKTKSEIPEI